MDRFSISRSWNEKILVLVLIHKVQKENVHPQYMGFRKQTVSTNVPMDTAFPDCFDHLQVFFQPRSVLEKKRGNVQLGTSIYDLSRIFGQLMLNAEESFFCFPFPRLI